MTEQVQLRDPNEMTSVERVGLINEYRSKVLNDEDVPDAELKYALEVLRVERSYTSSRTTKRTAAPAKTVSLDDFD